MTNEIDFVMKPRTGVGELIDAYADGKISYRELEVGIDALGYSTLSLFEMVRDIEPGKPAGG